MSTTTRTHERAHPGPASGPSSAPGPVPAESEPTVGALVRDLTEQIPELIRSELRLAQAEVGAKGKRLGVGLGMFGATGLLTFFALGTLVAAAVIGLAEALPAWAAALVVAAALLLLAGVAALVGRGKVKQATPPVPERAVHGLQADVETLKGIRR